MYDLIIIGGGPAGITAGIYASRQKIKTLLITDFFGGQMAKKSVDIENYPGFERISGFDLIAKFESHLRSKEAEILSGEKIKSLSQLKDKSFEVITESDKKANSRAVIVASGAEPRNLNIPGEKEFIGKGVSYCPICDGPLFRNKDVAVIGGGNAGCEAVLFLLKYVNKIYLLEYENNLLADEENQRAIDSDKVEILTSVQVKEIKGNRFVESLIYSDLKSSTEKELKVNAVFVEVGYQPATSFIQKGLAEFTEKGEIKVNFDTQETKTAGLFGAGDVSGGKCKQIVVAAGEGAKAALACSKFLNNIKR